MFQSACQVVFPTMMVIGKKSPYKLGQGNRAGTAEPPVGQGLALSQEAHLLALHTLKWVQPLK